VDTHPARRLHPKSSRRRSNYSCSTRRPLTGGAINPARVFGPALAVSFWNAHYVYWLGPLIGGALAGLVYKNCFLSKS
jgi:glycerol uptake facilitator-like aquaporin